MVGQKRWIHLDTFDLSHGELLRKLLVFFIVLHGSLFPDICKVNIQQKKWKRWNSEGEHWEHFKGHPISSKQWLLVPLAYQKMYNFRLDRGGNNMCTTLALAITSVPIQMPLFIWNIIIVQPNFERGLCAFSEGHLYLPQICNTSGSVRPKPVKPCVIKPVLVNIRMPKNGDLPFWIYLEDDDQSMITGWEFGGLEMIGGQVFSTKIKASTLRVHGISMCIHIGMYMYVHYNVYIYSIYNQMCVYIYIYIETHTYI